MPEGGKHSFYLVIANECKFVFEIRLIKNTLWSMKLKKVKLYSFLYLSHGWWLTRTECGRSWIREPVESNQGL